MTQELSVAASIDIRVASEAMLNHPLYRAWTDGSLPIETLRHYARQYFHHVDAFPRAVSAVYSACPTGLGGACLPKTLLRKRVSAKASSHTRICG
jgi:pyrroloquinoline-quinone synthase